MPADLTREFLQQVVRGSGWSLTEVESLSLEGEGISSLGDSFGGAWRLVYLNLARNNLSSLLGVEHLASLATLVLRENRVEAISEVGRLTNLPSLRDLDLRLNPIMMTASTFGGGSGRSLSGSMTSGGGGGGSRLSSNARADLLRVLPRLARLNGRRVVEGERLAHRHRRHQQHHQEEYAESPPRQRRVRQHHPEQQQQDQQQRLPQGSMATSARPATEEAPRNEAHDEDSAIWDASLGSSSTSSRRRRERVFFATDAAVVDTVASSRHRHHREQPPSRRAPRPRRRLGDHDEEAGENEFSRFFPAAGEASPIIPPPPSNPGKGRVAAAVGDGDTSPRVLRSSVCPTPRDGVDRRLEGFADNDGGCGATSEKGIEPEGHRFRQPSPPRTASKTEKIGMVAVTLRKKRDRPGVGDISWSKCSLDAGTLSGLHREDRCGGGVGGDGTGGDGRAPVVHDCARDPHGPIAGVGRLGASAVFHGGRVDLDGRVITPPQAAASASPAAAENDDGGDDVATLWLELGTNESLDNSRQPSLPPSLPYSSAAAATATTTTVSSAARAVEAFRRSAQRLGLPATAVAADGARGGDDSGNAGEDRDRDPQGPPSSPGSSMTSALGESSLVTAPVVDTLTAALAANTLVEAAAPSERPIAATSKPGLGFSHEGTTQKCTACGGGGVNVARNADGWAIAEGKSEAAAGRVFSSACDAREMDERWWAREREFTAKWAAREREFDLRWAARELEFDRRRREESKEFTAEMRSMLLGAHEALISSNAWLVDRLKTVEAAAAAAAAAKKPGPCSERCPYAAASSSIHGNAACDGPVQSGTSVVVGSRQAAPRGIGAAVPGADIVASAAPGPNSVDSTTAVTGEGGGGAGPLAEERRRPGAVDVQSRSASQGTVAPPSTGALHRDDDVLATAQTKRNTGMRFHEENTTLPANVGTHRAGALPSLGGEAGGERGRGLGVAATPVAGIAPVLCTRGCDHGVADHLDTTGVMTSFPGSSLEGAADPGPVAVAVTPRHAKGSSDGTGGCSRGEGMAGISRESGVFGGDPEVTISAAPGV